MIADNIVADSYLLANLCRDIADDIIAGLFILFDVDSEPDDHSEVLLLFVGCIVNFVVSYLIWMFQDSVPAGSYNDPFLSSVCVCVCVIPFDALVYLMCKVVQVGEVAMFTYHIPTWSAVQDPPVAVERLSEEERAA